MNNKLVDEQNSNIETKEEGGGTENSLSIDEEVLISLLETHPKLAIQLIQQGYSKLKNNFSSS